MNLWERLQGGANKVSGLLFPGFDASGVDPRAAQAARAQAMATLGAGLLGGSNFGQSYLAGQQSGFEPIEQARREAALRSDADWRKMQTDEITRRRAKEEADAAADQELIGLIGPLAQAGKYDEVANILASRGRLTEAKAAKGLGEKPGVTLREMQGPNGGTVLTDDTRWQYIPPERPSVVVTGGMGGAGKAPSGFRWAEGGGLEPIPGGPEDPMRPKGPALTPKDASVARNKLNQIAVARKQLALAKEKYANLRDSFSIGPGGQYLPTPAGKEFDAAIDSMRGSITAITRVPGVGAMSDYETRLDQSKFPNRGNYEEVVGQQLQSLDDLLNGLETGYRDMVGFENPAAPQAPPAAQPMESLPPAAKHKGKRIRDKQTGEVFVSDGMTWKKQ